MTAIRRRHEAARGCPKANHTGTSRRQNENFFVRAGSLTYPSPGGVQASPLLGAGNSECFHHGKQLSLVDVVIMLCRGEGGGVVSNRVEFGFPLFVRWHVPLTSLLREHRSNSICRSIGLQIEAAFEVRLNENWLSAHEGFECFECLELGFPPMPHYTFLR